MSNNRRISGSFHNLGIGIVVKQKKIDKYELDIALIETMGEHSETYDLFKKKKKKKKKKGGGGGSNPFKKSIIVKARWFQDGSNQYSPPTMYPGETVEVYGFGDSNENLLWKPKFYEPDIKGQEKLVYGVSGIPRKKLSDRKKDKYWWIGTKEKGKKYDKKYGVYMILDGFKGTAGFVVGKKVKGNKTKRVVSIMADGQKNKIDLGNDKSGLTIEKGKVSINTDTVKIKATDTEIASSGSFKVDSASKTLGGGTLDIDSDLALNGSTTVNAPVTGNQQWVDDAGNKPV